MKQLTLLLLALLIVPAALAADDAVVLAVETSDQLLPAGSCSAELSTPVNAAADAKAGESLKVETASLYDCEEICRCTQLNTPPVTKVGATCLKARQKAAAAARALAVCPSHSTGKCGPTTHSVDPCVPIPNGFSATAVATYHCEFCYERCF